MVVEVRHSDGRTRVERLDLDGGGTSHLGLPESDGYLSVGCHSDDGRSGVCTYYPGESKTIGFTLRKGSILLDSG